MLSSKNILKAKINSVNTQGLFSLVSARLENNKNLQAFISSNSFKHLELKKGQFILMIFKASAVIVSKNECAIRSSCENELNGKIVKITQGLVQVLIEIDCLGVIISAMITKDSYEYMQLALNDNVNVLINSSSIILGIKE